MAGHLLSTVNPEAAQEADSGRLVPHHGSGGGDLLALRPTLVPKIGEVVAYHPRPGEFRRGRTEFPAMVLQRDEASRTLDLLIFYDRDDQHTMEGVPEWPQGQMTLGWSRIDSALSDDPRVPELEARLAALEELVATLKSALLGNLDMPEGESVLSILDEHEDRIGVVESNARESAADLKALRSKAPEKQAKPSKAKPTTE